MIELPLDTRQLLKTIAWRDLMAMRPVDGVVECLHPLPWLLASWLFASLGSWGAAITCSFMFFLTALRLNHEAIHHNLGFARRGHRLVLHGLSALMLGSNSAVAHNHLHHHVRVGKPDDLEGKCGRMSAWKVFVFGPVFPIEMHLAAWHRGGPGLRRRMQIDGALNAAVIALALVAGAPLLVYHVAVMVAAQCLTAFFAVWITHHDCEDEGLIARTQRSPLVNFLSYNMFLHLEHHLFPAVPVRRLALLAARLDAAVPAIAQRARHVVPLPGRRAASRLMHQADWRLP